MRFIDWKKWIFSLPWSMRWFVILILIRPVIDVFYFLKDVNPFLSPLYIVGVLTPVLIFLSFNSRKLPKRNRNKVDKYFFIWGLLVLVNVVSLIIMDTSIQTFGNGLKYIIPLLLFFYLRRFVHAKRHLHGLLQTFLYSAIFPAFLLIYEHLVGPISPQVTRGSEVRFQGVYADSGNYIFYIIGPFLILSYFYLEKKRLQTGYFLSKKALILFFPLFLLGLASIKHVASWVVFAMLFVLLLLFRFRTRGLSIPFLIIILGISIFSQSIFETQIRPLINSEISVLKGEIDVERSFHGRTSRWKRYFTTWEKMPTFTQVFGVALYNFFESFEGINFGINYELKEKIPIMVSGGMHSDYVRILFLSGILGLVLYLIFIFGLFWSCKRFDPVDRFLIIGAILVILLYSVTTNPHLYHPLLYFILPIFAYSLLPVRVLKGEKNTDRKDRDQAKEEQR